MAIVAEPTSTTPQIKADADGAQWAWEHGGKYVYAKPVPAQPKAARQKSMTTIAREVLAKYMGAGAPDFLDWGFRFLVDTERDALLIGYAYRNNVNGYKIEFAGGAQKYSVTIWNDKAKAMGCDV